MTPQEKLQAILDVLDIKVSTIDLDERRVNLMLEKLTKTARVVSAMGPSPIRTPTIPPFTGDWKLP